MMVFCFRMVPDREILILMHKPDLKVSCRVRAGPENCHLFLRINYLTNIANLF